MHWEKFQNLSELNKYLGEQLAKNRRYSVDSLMGFPGSFLDREVFPEKMDPNSMYWKLLRENPNHIGCHTFTKGESAFSGTQDIERELIRICAEEILGAETGNYDGYVSTGGTEANIQALWLFRNKYIEDNYVEDPNCDANTLQHYFIDHIKEIDVIYSKDTHYSVYKAAHLLNLHQMAIPVDNYTRQINLNELSNYIDRAINGGKKFFIIVLNMGTIMFGSVDEITPITNLLESKDIQYTIHVDAAFGGFIYPFTNPDNELSFANKKINSFTLDAHKMLQSPYSTGVFITRKYINENGVIKNKKRPIEYVTTNEACYVEGNDSTLCGSRSGANAVSIWMILKIYGPDGGVEFCSELLRRTDIICKALDEFNIGYYRNKYMNIVAIAATDEVKKIANKHNLVPDTHSGDTNWYKIVVMDHVGGDMINNFIRDLRLAKSV